MSEEVGKVGQLIADPQRRRAFASNPSQALKDAGVDESKIPKGVRDALYDMNEHQLGLVARLNASLDEAGVEPEFQAQIV
ncbi:MAG: hypothetical protein M3322_09180 [Actinomycetota bacterium]|nr:hypothetical protein [Actinomycetota bacterium]